MNKKEYIIVFFLIFITLFVFACNKKDDISRPQTYSSTSLHFNIEGRFRRSVTTPPIALSEEERVRTVRIMIFDFYTGKLEHNILKTGAPDLDFAVEETVNGVKGTSKTVVVLANEQTSMTAQLLAIQNYSDLKAMSLGDETTYVSGDANLYLPSMAEQGVITAAANQTIHMQLKRIVGKVELSFIKEANYNADVQLKEILILRAATKTSILESAPLDATTTSLVDLTPKSFTSMIPASTGMPLNAYSAYLYEHFGTTTALTDATATAVKITLEYNSGTTEARIKDHTFPIRCNEGISPVYGVLRNVFTRIQIEVGPEKLDINYKILPWDKVPDYDKNLGDEESSTATEGWEEETPQDEVLGS